MPEDARDEVATHARRDCGCHPIRFGAFVVLVVGQAVCCEGRAVLMAQAVDGSGAAWHVAGACRPKRTALRRLRAWAAMEAV
jgi:hypothetical protein